MDSNDYYTLLQKVQINKHKEEIISHTRLETLKEF